MNILKTTAALGLAALLLAGGPAQAQRPGGGRGGFGGPGFGGGAGLLGNPGVQKELKLDDKQTEEAKKLTDSLRAKMESNRESLSGLEGDARREKMQALMKDQAAESTKAIEGLLTADQLKRFHQITLQQRGPAALASPELQDEFKITADQKEKLQTIQRESGAKMRELFTPGGGGDREAAREKITALRKETHEKFLGVLTDDQKKLWSEKTGAPFEVQFERRRPGN